MGSNRVSIHFFTGDGVSFEITFPTDIAERTMMRPGIEAPNCSFSPVVLEERLTDVSITRWALFEKRIVSTMMMPERIRRSVGAGIGSASPPIAKVFGSAP